MIIYKQIIRINKISRGCISMAQTKTNAMRILDKLAIPYKTYEYEHEEGAIDGISVAERIQQPVACVFKTLVTIGNSRNYYIFVIPVDKELNLKAAAKSISEKSVEMIKVTDINKITGYIRGGCSPIGMKKLYKTVIHQSCLEQDRIIFSGGKIGCQIEMAPDALIALVKAEVYDVAE